MANKPIDSKTKVKNNTKGSPFLAALFKVLGTLIIVGVLVFSIPAAVPRIMGYELYNIVSGSMEPTIPVNAAVYVQKVNPSELETGHILAFNMNGDVVVHRITSNDLEAQELHTKGDANDTEDLWAVPYSDCLGRVRVSVRMLGGILDFSTSSTGKFYIFFILAAGIIFSILGKSLTPPDELYEPEEKEKKGKVKPAKVSSKSPVKTAEKAPEKKQSALLAVAESMGTSSPKTVTVNDALNNTVDESILASEPNPADFEVDKPVSLADLAKDYKVDSLESEKKEEVKPENAAAKPTSNVKAEEKNLSEEKNTEVKSANSEEIAAKRAAKQKEQEKYKKMLNTIIIIIILLVVALLGVAGAIFFINYRYSKMDEQTSSQVEQFTKEPSTEEVVVAEEIPDDAFVLHTTQKCPIDVDFDALWEVNPDVVGWIYCEDTVINYPILQGEDDEFYLHHDLNGKKTSAGSIFVDCNNMGDFTDVNSIIYGHHMKNGSMFACLQNWEKQDFYDAHKYMWIITPDGNYEVWIYSGYLTDAYSDSYLGIRNWGEMAEEYITTAQANSDITPLVNFDTFKKCEEKDQRYIMLSTCEYEFQNARYVIHGKLVKETPGVYGNPELDGSGSTVSTETDEAVDSEIEENTEETEADINFENLVEIKDINTATSNNIEGKYSVLKVDSSKCSQTFLTNYYYNYVKKHPDLLWNVIYYSDKSDYTGIYTSKGLIEKDVTLDTYGNLVDSTNETVYKEADNNTLEECAEEFIP